MHIQELIKLEPGQDLSIANTFFGYTGKAQITLDSGEVLHWLYAGKESLLALAHSDEELVSFHVLDEELDEPDGGMILYHGKEYEFTYEDVGVVAHVEGELGAEEEDRVSFSDYENEAGDRIRLVTNDNTGESMALWGQLVTEDEVSIA